MTGFRMPKVERELITATSSVTLSPYDMNKTVCNVGATGSVTITLPAAANCPPGGDILVLSCADQTLQVSAANTSELIAFNDVAANSVALSTSSEKAGGGWLFTCVGSKWHVACLTEETQTVTVAT